MNTNDPEGEYKREPLLSDVQMKLELWYDLPVRTKDQLNEEAERRGGEKVRRWYEAKITKGELMVVKTARPVDRHCSNCGHFTDDGDPLGATTYAFCPGCGAKIIEG